MKGTTRKTKTFLEQSLKDSELRYRRLFEATQDGILILDAETGMIDDVNPYLINMLGYSRAEFIKKKLWEVGAFKDIDASQETFRALQENEYIRYEDLPLKTKDGQLIQVESVSNVYLVGGKKVIQCNVRDISDHRRIVKALQENEKKYHDLVNQSPDGFFIIESSGNILTVNKSMCRELEFSEEELLSMNIWDIIPEQYLDQYRERLTKILEGKSLVDEPAEYTVHGKDGKVHYVEVLSAPHYSGKNIIGFQGVARDITARKQAEEALLESERRYQMAIWATKDVIRERNFPANTISWNDSLQKLFHYPADEIEPTVDWWEDHIHPSERIKVINSIQTALDQGEDFWSKEYRFRLVDGSYADIFDRGYILYNEQGKPLKLIGAMVDITEQKRAEDALRESEERYRLLVETLPDGVVVHSQGRIVFANPASATIIGAVSPDDLTGKPVIGFVHPDYGELALKRIQQALIEGVPVLLAEEKFVRQDGTAVDVEVSAIPFSYAGKPAMLTVFNDITERKRAQDALQESKLMIEKIINTIPARVFWKDMDLVYLGCNALFARDAGFTDPKEIIGKDDSQMGWRDQAELYRDDDRQVIESGRSKLLIEEPQTTPEGNTITLLTSKVPLRSSMGEVIGVLGTYLDITERKMAQERIQRQRGHLAAMSTIDRVIASIFDIKLSLSEILTHVTTDLNIDAAAILIMNSNSQMLEYGAERGFRAKAIRKAQVRLGESYAGRVALERQLIQIQNLRDEPDNLFLTTLLTGEDFVCYYGVPLIVKGQVKGVLEVFHRTLLEPDTEWFDFLNALARQTAIAIENYTLFESLQRSNLELALAYDATIEGWSRALDLRDKETEGHTLRVTEMTVKLARDFGLSDDELVHVRWGALLHDIGKMGVPDEILLKPDSLTDDEWVKMKEHPRFAYELLSSISFLRHALDIPYCHHEKWDGTGYPCGLKGTQIPLVARIFAVVDVWDALISERPYRPPWTKEKAREYIHTSSRTHFDPQVVDVFMQMLNQT